MSRTTSELPAASAWSKDDGQRALDALQQVLEDQDWPEGEVRFKQSTLVEHLRQRGVGRALALALIEDLLALKVFRAGKSFWDLKIFVRFDGRQTDEATPNRYLHTTRDSWLAHLASRKTQSALMQVNPSDSVAGLSNLSKDAEGDSQRWITIAAAAGISGINRGVISRAVDAGELKSNGQKGRGKRKIDAAAFTLWQVERSKKAEQAESSEHVKRLFDKHVAD